MGYLRLYPAAIGTTEIALFWEAVAGATSYVAQVGTATTLSDTFNANVGNLLTTVVLVPAGTYYTRTVVVGGAHAGELTTGGEQTVTVT